MIQVCEKPGRHTEVEVLADRVRQRIKAGELKGFDNEVLMAWAFWDALISDAREASAEVLTATGVLDFCGAWGTDCRTWVLAAAW